ncbi:unnamed protein product [Adineta ricciae]|uniref:Uncharacterized protein n=1 Tax=Adineta ricciae TaxID=249248 RepID=A0A815A6S5_ADIRI|nr:unnamed protein product [Adineta ricciae]
MFILIRQKNSPICFSLKHHPSEINDDNASPEIYCQISSNSYFYTSLLRELSSSVYFANIFHDLLSHSKTKFNRQRLKSVFGLISRRDNVIYLKVHDYINNYDEAINRYWASIQLHVLVKRVRYESSWAWLSTLGGGHSCLGEESARHAKEAEMISKNQIDLSSEIGDPNALVKSYLFLSLSYLQQKRFDEVQTILRFQYRRIQQKDITEDRLPVMCVIYGIILTIHQSKPYTIVHGRKIKTRNSSLVKWIIEQIQISSKENIQESFVVTHESNIDLDTIINQICDLVLQDLVLPWYQHVSYEQITFSQTLKQEIHLIVSNLKTRCASIDWVKVISNDIVVQFADHYQQVRRSTLHREEYPFRLHSYLATDECENEYLRSMSETLLLLLLPPSYSSTLAIRHLLREILVFRVLKPTINLICEPDYFNENILLKIEQLNINHEQKLRKFTLASNYENFIKLIETSNDLDKLEQFWNYIVTEIMQATAIRNLLKEGVISNDNHQARLGTKGELLMSRDLTKYLNQLRRAKVVCERHITANGGRSYLLVDASTNKLNLANRKILSLNMILSCITGRHYLHQFLETFGTHALVKFWYDIWKLHSAASNERHRVATNIYKTYITRFGSAVRDEIDNATVVRMKSFLVGEQSEPDAFFHAQSVVYRVLQRDYYASFLVSKQYDALCRTFNPSNLQDFDLKEQLLGWSTPITADENYDESNESRASSQQADALNEEPSQSVPKRLADLRNQLENKQYALTAAKEGATFDATILASVERDCADLNQEISTLECLLENVDLWWSFLGQWQAQVLSDVIGNGRSCLAVLIRSPNSEQDQVGWVITRSIHAWQHFYFRLKELQSSLPTIDYFRTRHRQFSQLLYDKALCQQISEQLETFLQAILLDEHISSFELVYQFLNPSIVDNDRQSSNLIPAKKKHSNSSKHIFDKFRSDKASSELLEMDSVRFLEGRADSIAKPFYAFIDILFDEQGGLLKLIRMTLVQFIRVTYGSTINRQVRRFIVSLFQEESVVKCLIMFRDSFWPATPSAERQTRTDEEKLERRQQAKRQLLTNIPETISLIFGSDNARLGAERLFELFQDVQLNKHLCHKLMVLIMSEIFPELQIKL